MQICFPFVCLVFFHLFQAFYDPLSRPWKRNDTSPSEFSLRMCSAFFCLSFRFPTETLIRHFRYPIRKSHKILLTTMVSFIPSALTIFTAFRNQRRKKNAKITKDFFLVLFTYLVRRYGSCRGFTFSRFNFFYLSSAVTVAGRLLWREYLTEYLILIYRLIYNL